MVLDGHVTYESGDPVDPVTVDIVNTNTSKSYTSEITGNYYKTKLLLGFDIWTDPEPAPFEITATDTYGNQGVVQHDFTDIYNVNTIDVTVTIIGDVDGDGDVDLSDLAALLGAYGTSCGDPNYNPDADLDGDCDVDLSDLAALLGHYGQP